MGGIVMTDIKLLTLLYDYYGAQRNVVLSMTCAMSYFAHGREQDSFAYLFEWCEDKDRREELWEQLKHKYYRAVRLKEGYE